MESNTQTINTLKAHLAINVKDVTNSIEFYRKMLGIEPSKVRTGTLRRIAADGGA